MVKLSDSDFKDVIDNFDEFMDVHGYLTMEATAERVHISMASMYIMLQNNRVPGVIKIGKTKYIPKTWKRGAYKNVPEGYLTIDDTAKRWHCTSAAIRHMIYDGRLIDFLTIGKKHYIRDDLEYPCGKIESNAPEGYITVTQAATKFECTDSTIRTKIYRGELSGDDVIKINHRYYISDKAHIHIVRSTKGAAV